MSESRIQNRESGIKKAGGRSGRRGFTILELLIVVAIIAVLLSVLLPATQGLRQKAREKQRDADQIALASAIRAFRSEYGYWPTSEVKPTDGALTPDQLTVIRTYLLSSGSANKNGKPFWDVDGVVTNVVTRQPFSISIDVVNDAVTVQ